MIPIELYNTIYFVAISVITIFTILPLLDHRLLSYFPKINLKIGAIILLCTVILFIGLRDPMGHWRYFGDTSAYTRTYFDIKHGYRTEFNKDPGFFLYMRIIANVFPITFFYILSACFYVLLPHITFRKWFGEYSFFGLVALVVSMSFWPFGINTLRSGLAAAIFIFALQFQKKKWLKWIFLILSVTFHKGMLLPFFAYILAHYLKNTKRLVQLWMLAIPLSYYFGNVLEEYFKNMLTMSSFLQDSRADTYFEENPYLEIKFRWDFIVYSSIPIAFGLWYIYKNLFKENLYTRLVNTYIIVNTVWLILMRVAYTDRIAYLSWFLIPILLVYPLLRDEVRIGSKTKFLFIILILNLSFTIFMNIN
ncbi:MAG: hypothetical protein CMC08_01950 [Flavobacteriaceae bacterium]|nr:hypothetical protein [Flavobacteriaceae bacterium]